MKLLYYKVSEHYTVCLYIGHGFESDLSVHVGIIRNILIVSIKPKTKKLVFVFSAKHSAKIGWLGIKIICANGRHVYPRTVVSVGQ